MGERKFPLAFANIERGERGGVAKWGQGREGNLAWLFHGSSMAGWAQLVAPRLSSASYCFRFHTGRAWIMLRGCVALSKEL